MRIFSFLVFLLWRWSVFTPLSFELVKVMCTESKGNDCHCICLLVAPYSNTDLGVPLVGCPKTDGDWPMGNMDPDLVFLCYKIGFALSHLAVMCRSELPPWISVWPELVRPCCWLAACQGAGDTCWGTGPVSCPWSASLGPALWESLGSCNPLISLFTNRKEHFTCWRRCWWHVRDVLYFL